MKKIIGMGLVLGTFAALGAPSRTAEAQVTTLRVPLLLSTVSVGCSNPGSSQDVAKTPVLKNTTTATIPAGTVLRWTASDGDKGSQTLSAALAPSATVKAQGSLAGNAYTCSGNFSPKADLVVKSVSWEGASSVAVQIGNASPWLGAGQSKVQLEMVSCGGTVLKTVSTEAPSIAQSGAAKVSFSATTPQQKYYFRVKADVGLQVPESIETNNLFDGINSCIR